MRPKLRTTFKRTVPLALLAACSLIIASSSSGVTLYDGSYATDMSSSTPGGLAPANGAVLSYPKDNVRLGWDHVPGAKQYQVQVARQTATNADCAASGAFQLDNIVLTSTTSQNQWVPSLATAEEGKDIWVGAYCWRVRTTGEGYGAWSSANRFVKTWSSAISGLKFFNDHDGAVPRTAGSADSASGSAVTRNAGYVTWDALPGASEYEVQVSSSQSFAQPSLVTTRTGVRGTSVALLHLPDDTYYWRVRGIAPNGTEGGWSTGANAFTVRWLDANWSAPTKLWPADDAVESEMRIGWTPMPGATYYEYQVSTAPGCFWNPDAPSSAPLPYGAWVGYAAKYEENPPPNTSPRLLSTGDPQPTHCRVSDVRAQTMNNWVTVQDMIGEEAGANIDTPCMDETGMVLCEPAGLPTNQVRDWGPAFSGMNEAPGSSADGRYSSKYQIYWRARPVYVATQEDESGWKIGGEKGLVAYGSWTKFTSSSVNRHHRFSYDPTTAPFSVTGARCDDGGSPADLDCLEHVGTSMQADEAPGVKSSLSMQFPVLTWKPFPSADGYIVEIARDPLFNNIALTTSVAGGTQQSYALNRSMPDNSEGTGYWWRVVPCQYDSPPPGYNPRCLPVYASSSAGLPLSYGLGGHSDMGVAQTFAKQSAMRTVVVPGFEGASPLIRWARTDVADTDFAGWSQGLAGASRYELELSRTPFFSGDSLIKIETTIPRAVPFADTGEDGSNKAIDDGLWYYHVRALDTNGVAGAWSKVDSFTKRVDAPVPTGANGEVGDGVSVSWSPVEGAGAYEIQWTTDSGFEAAPSVATTLQTTFRIPDSKLGRQYWRVRALVGEVKGQWSGAVRYVDIVPPTTIRYGVNRAKTIAGSKVQITGELQVAGAATNGQRMRLQRKTGGCDNARGRYVDSSTATTGKEADDGQVDIPARVTQNTCFRLAWAGASQVKYSAPIAVKVVPNIKVTKNRKLVRRGSSYCVSMRSNVAINGRWRVQYRVGKTWRTTRSGMVRNKKSARLCPKITKAGRYSTRVVFDRMVKQRQGWTQFENVTKGTGTVRVNDVWTVVRGR